MSKPEFEDFAPPIFGVLFYLFLFLAMIKVIVLAITKPIVIGITCLILLGICAGYGLIVGIILVIIDFPTRSDRDLKKFVKGLCWLFGSSSVLALIIILLFYLFPKF